MNAAPSFATLLESFFTRRLMNQRRASPHTIASYRDSFRLLLRFAQQRLRKAPSDLALADVDAPLVLAFLDEQEQRRGASARTRNLRLTAIHSFFRYVAFESPAHAAQAQRVLAVPSKRFTRTLVNYLTRAEVDALLAAPDRSSWSGRRDHALILLAVQTGLRLSELTGLQSEDLSMGTGSHVRVIGKGRKERCTPLSRVAARADQGDRATAVPQRARWAPELARRALPAGQACGYGERQLPIAGKQTRDTSCAAPHDRNGLASSRRRAGAHRAVARARVDRDDTEVPGREPCIEGTGAGQDDAAGRQGRPVSAGGQVARVPDEPLIVRGLCAVVNRLHPCAQHPLRDIVRRWT